MGGIIGGQLQKNRRKKNRPPIDPPFNEAVTLETPSLFTAVYWAQRGKREEKE